MLKFLGLRLPGNACLTPWYQKLFWFTLSLNLPLRPSVGAETLMLAQMVGRHKKQLNEPKALRQ